MLPVRNPKLRRLWGCRTVFVLLCPYLRSVCLDEPVNGIGDVTRSVSVQRFDCLAYL